MNRVVTGLQSKAVTAHEINNNIRIFCENNNIIFNIEKIEELLFEQSIDISNHLALKDFDYLLNNGYLTELSKSSILSILCDYEQVF